MSEVDSLRWMYSDVMVSHREREDEQKSNLQNPRLVSSILCLGLVCSACLHVISVYTLRMYIVMHLCMFAVRGIYL